MGCIFDALMLKKELLYVHLFEQGLHKTCFSRKLEGTTGAENKINAGNEKNVGSANRDM